MGHAMDEVEVARRDVASRPGIVFLRRASSQGEEQGAFVIAQSQRLAEAVEYLG
jgi:hypothetical protein